MKFTFDASELQAAGAVFQKAGDSLSKTVIRQIMRKSLRPALAKAKQIVPVGGGRSKLGYGRGKKKNERQMAYDRGGATKRDLRIDVKDDRTNQSEIVGLVGVKQGRNAVGWRTHFITRGVRAQTDRKRRRIPEQAANDFIAQTYNQTSSEVLNTFGKEATEAAANFISKNLKKKK